MLGFLYGKRFGSKIAWGNRKEGDRVGRSEYRNPPQPFSVLVPVPKCHTPSYCLRLFSSQIFPVKIPQNFWKLVILHTYLPLKMEQSVPKRRHINFRLREITQKKAYDIQNTGKVWNQEDISCLKTSGIRKKLACSTYDSTNAWRDNVF
jgi:hypothetical protein